MRDREREVTGEIRKKYGQRGAEPHDKRARKGRGHEVRVKSEVRNGIAADDTKESGSLGVFQTQRQRRRQEGRSLTSGFLASVFQ